MFLKTVVNQKLHGQDIVNVLCWAGSDATLANGQQITDALQQIYQDELSPVQASAYSFESVTIYDAEAAPNTPGTIFNPTGGGHVGVGTGAALPNQVAALLAFNSIVGPPWRGRTYLGGFTVNQISALGTWVSAADTAIEDFGGRLQSFGADTGLIMTHSIIGGDTSVPLPDRSAIVSTYTRRDIPANQRRRRIGVGS